jgi:RNA polymerase sigma-70 factor, ECF subfamily
MWMATSMQTQTDEELIKAFARGDERALQGLAQRYECSLLGLASGMLQRQDLAMDAVQETWIRVIRFSRKFDGRSAFKTWLYRILVNQCRSMRSAQRRRSVSLTSTNTIDKESDAEPVHAELQVSVAAAIERLPEAKRAILLLCYHRGMTHEHAAHILEIPLGTLKSRLHSALNELRSIMNTHNSEIAHEQRA